MEIRAWPIPQALKEEIDQHYRTNFSLQLKDSDLLTIIRLITFDGVAPKLVLADIFNLMNYVQCQFLPGKLRGVGVEIGAGPGVFSAVLARLPGVAVVYAVEVCENIVRELMPKVVNEIARDQAQKVIGCVGDFDHLDLPAAQVNFIFDFFSFHHSSDLVTTFKEMYRVLVPGGVVVCLDKARNNNLSLADLEKLLDREYSPTAKKMMGVDPHIFLTRRMNGEKEYRLKDWEAAFTQAGFSRTEHFHLARTNSNNRLVWWLKNLLATLPPRWQSRLTRFVPELQGNRNDLETAHRVYTSLLANFPKEISLIIAYK